MSRFFSYIATVLVCLSCSDSKKPNSPIELKEDFKDYWFAGEAEITSYDLEQARYGEIREGEAVLIFVTEDLLPGEQVKANLQDSKNIPVLKLNATKNFLTGIYPYSIMQSTFYPLDGQKHALKIAASIQEWCGQVYMQLNNREKYNIESHSYFQGEADQEFKLKKVALENEIWNQLRIDPDLVPTGDFEMIPSFEYLRLSHEETKPYKAFGEFFTANNFNIYTLNYPDLQREIKIYFSKGFPHHIEKWEESYPSGTGTNKAILTTKAVKKKRIKSDYWNKNSNNNLPLRQKLDLN
ncbi:septum formation inhibitor Maf [Christiangramia sabulilitoris]|uniref:Septum formation inhibitor Maf n=1 Tax=Christiangramia sabulilitoris TaxID=2583991 RepID=A0A550I5R0_9FLAO|nr:septum formation inhibitor Maf [Christiangramia sabulilitoris]TRO66324.1 septum formation inhibitor Maf [Christiangramia sabulilitoris]